MRWCQSQQRQQKAGRSRWERPAFPLPLRAPEHDYGKRKYLKRFGPALQAHQGVEEILAGAQGPADEALAGVHRAVNGGIHSAEDAQDAPGRNAAHHQQGAAAAYGDDSLDGGLGGSAAVGVHHLFQ